MRSEEQANAMVDHLLRHQSGRLVASLVSIFGPARIDLIEDVVQESLVEAIRRWRFHGVPDNPTAWLTQVGKRRALDALRRDATLRRHESGVRQRLESLAQNPEHDGLDDQVRLMFLCCHPDLPREARVALTLKLVAGMGTAEVARAFLVTETAMAQRLVRAKRDIRERGLTLDMPGADELPGRLQSVLQTVYLLFNEGYAAGQGDDVVQRDRLEEACRLGAMLVRDARTASPAAHALQALMLFHASRLDARSHDGTLLLLEEQDRSKWDHRMIRLGFEHLGRSMAGEELTSYHIEAGIAAAHARAPSFEQTDWTEIVELYDLLYRHKPSSVVGLNRAAAIAMSRGPEAGLEALDQLDDMAGYLHHAVVRGELLRRAGRTREAREQLELAMEMPSSAPQRVLISRRLESLVEC